MGLRGLVADHQEQMTASLVALANHERLIDVCQPVYARCSVDDSPLRLSTGADLRRVTGQATQSQRPQVQGFLCQEAEPSTRRGVAGAM
jgi:hypothetical protein